MHAKRFRIEVRPPHREARRRQRDASQTNETGRSHSADSPRHWRAGERRTGENDVPRKAAPRSPECGPPVIRRQRPPARPYVNRTGNPRDRCPRRHDSSLQRAVRRLGSDAAQTSVRRLSSRRPVRWARPQLGTPRASGSAAFSPSIRSRDRPRPSICKLNRWSGRQLRRDECSIFRVLQRDRALNEADRKVQPTECETGNFCPGRGCGSSIPPPRDGD